jgi:Holliday junction resolvasome RuvABC DNA-binding subunit
VDPGAEADAQAFRAFGALGFREEQTHRALAQLRADAQVGNANTERVLPAALRVLTDARGLCSPLRPTVERARR